MSSILAYFKSMTLGHVLVILAFLVGSIWGIAQALQGQTVSLQAVLPLAILALSHAWTFFQNPPQTPSDALEQGEQIVAGKGSQRGVATLRLVGALSVTALLGVLMFAPRSQTAGSTLVASGQGCAWWTKNAAPVEQDIAKDTTCVLGAILAGAANPAAVAAVCSGLTIQQISAIAVNLFDFYALGQTDSGFAGAARPPVPGLPTSLSAADFAKLLAFHNHS